MKPIENKVRINCESMGRNCIFVTLRLLNMNSTFEIITVNFLARVVRFGSLSNLSSRKDAGLFFTLTSNNLR